MRKVLLLAVLVIATFVVGRLAINHFDASCFEVAGTDFVDGAHTPSPLATQKGQGYDGQFFYRYALAPFDGRNNVYGVQVDHPAYRMQRIAYPFFAWLLSFGGRPALVPWALLLANILAFAGVFFYAYKFAVAVGGREGQVLLPLLLCGLYMTLARDLAELVELFFFTAAVYYFVASRYLAGSVFAAFAVLAKETSLLALVPLVACLLVRDIKNGRSSPRLFYLLIPFLLFAAWKIFIYTTIPSGPEPALRFESIGMPFKGIVQGFRENFDFSTSKNALQFCFWMAYLGWQIYFAGLVARNISFKSMGTLDNVGMLQIIYVIWLAFAICCSDNIYGDDWGFERIFSLWNMVGILILIAGKRKVGTLFVLCSAALVLLTAVRLVIRI